MKLKHITFPDRMSDELAKRSQRLLVSEASIVRTAVSYYFQHSPMPDLEAPGGAGEIEGIGPYGATSTEAIMFESQQRIKKQRAQRKQRTQRTRKKALTPAPSEKETAGEPEMLSAPAQYAADSEEAPKPSSQSWKQMELPFDPPLEAEKE